MNRQTFLQLIRHPGNITPEDLRDLEAFVLQYPYCQNAHLLIAKYYADNGHMLAGLKVKKAALYTADRSRLKELIEETDKENAEVLKKTASFIPEETKDIEIEQLAVKIIPEEIIQKQTPEVLHEKEKTELADSTEEPALVTSESIEKSGQTTKISEEQQTKDELLEELRQSLIALRESRKKAFIQKDKPLEELINTEENTNTEYSIQALDAEVLIENITPNSETEVDSLPVEEKIPVEETILSEEETLQEEAVLTDEKTPAEEILQLEDPIEEKHPVEEITVSETELIETLETNTVETGDSVSNQDPVTETQEEPALLLLSPTDHYYPDRGRGPMPIPSSVEYHPVGELQQDLMMRYFEYQNQKRLIFKKNRKKEDEIIDKLSKEELVMPKMNVKTLPEETEDLSTKSSTLQKGPISENFARILVLQGKTAKAIEIYQELSLKIPEKKAYFEAQIEKLKTKLG